MNGRALPALLVALVFFVPGPAGRARAQEAAATREGSQEAPPTRADLLRAAREARRAHLEPPRRGLVEKTLMALESSLVGSKVAAGYGGFRPVSGGLPNGHGLDVGVGYFRTGIGQAYPRWDTANRLDAEVFATYSVESHRQLQGSATWNNLGGTRLALRGHGQVYDWPDRTYFGRGPDSDRDRSAAYALAGSVIGADALYRLDESAVLGIGLARVRTDTGAPGSDHRQSAGDAFEPGQRPGFGLEQVHRRLDAFVEVDRRDSDALPRSGGLYSVRYSDYDDRSEGDASFRRWEIHVQQFLPLREKRRVFGLRAWSVITEPDAGAEVPLQFWPVLGAGTRMRGFEFARFADRNLLLLSGEYRWEVWWLLEAALFVDLGNVSEHPGDLFERMKSTYGVGLRIHGSESMVLGTDFAWGDEGFRVHLLLSYPFRVGGAIR